MRQIRRFWPAGSPIPRHAGGALATRSSDSASWEPLARERRAELSDGHLIVVTGVGRVDAYFSDAATRPATVVNLAFEAPLRAELTIADMTEEDLWDLWEHPEITFEDPVFDDALLVRGVEHFARSVLSAECRAALLELRLACDHLRIDRERLTVMVLGSRIRAPRLSALLDLVEAAGRHLLPGKQRKDRAYR